MFDQKEYLKKMKLIFYQLFNRKLPFVVFDRFIPEEDPFPAWLFTNISYESILMYDAKPDYFCANVLMNDKEFYTTFYQLFPLLQNTPCVIRIVDFLSALSKADDITRCSINRIMDEVVLTYMEKDQTVDKTIGTCLLEIDVEMYKKIYTSGIIPSVLPARREFRAEDLKEDKFIIEMDDGDETPEHIPRKARIIIQVGLTIPSIPMFVKNYKENDPDANVCELVTGYDGDSVLANARYHNNLLSCTITQPAQRWFVRRNSTI